MVSPEFNLILIFPVVKYSLLIRHNIYATVMRKKNMKNKTLIIFIAMLTGLLFPGLIVTVQGNDCCRDGKLKVADGYEYEVIVTGLRRIDNIARIPDSLSSWGV